MLKMSKNINETTRHLKFCYISILTNLRCYKIEAKKSSMYK